MKVIIKNFGTTFEIERDQILSISPSYDGLSIILNNNLNISYSNMNMPQQIRDIISASFESFKKGTLTIDLTNFIKPVVISTM